MEEGLIKILLNSGANILSPSCGPCLGTGQGIPADNQVVISTANRNFLGRMGMKGHIFILHPLRQLLFCTKGEMTDPRGVVANDKFPFQISRVKQFLLIKMKTENPKISGIMLMLII